MSDIISAYKDRARFGKLARQLGISMSLIGGIHVVGSVNQSLPVPGSTSSSGAGTIGQTWFRTAFGPRYLGKNLVLWLGTAWHELGHVLWSDYTSAVTPALNLLEDARIEALLITRYPKMRTALIAMLTHLLKDGQNTGHHAYLYAWVVGRSHLDPQIRADARAMVEAPVADEITSIFKRYLAMGSRYDSNLAHTLAARLTEILELEGEVGADKADKVCSHARGGGKGEAVPIPDEYIDQIGEAGEADPNAETTTAGDLVSRLLDAVQDAIEADSGLQDEVADLLVSMRGAGGGDGTINAAGARTQPTERAKELAEGIRKAAIRFNDESGKGLVRRRDHGRLRPIRYETYEDIETAYDQWEPGLDQEMFIGILMDMSGSMTSSAVTHMLYGLEVGLSSVAEVKVALFNDAFGVPPVPNSVHTMIEVTCNGGTKPMPGMAYMHDISLAAHQQNRIVILYTDGTFDDDTEYEGTLAFMQDLKAKGVNIRVLLQGSNAAYVFEGANRRYGSPLAPHEMVEVMRLSDMPGIILGWTRNVLTRGGG